ncbi:MAG TPA: SAM-dependent methyltransferase [Pyrinomonadaceae bacterium]|jgi:SAM-dependent MidA family methyltransferase
MNEPDAELAARPPLAERLRRRIRRAEAGAITFREWMEAALYDAQEGYYCRRDRTRWGRAGDYRTSAETTPLFAATFARYFAALYEELGSPREWSIVEAGAGGGDFAFVVLETLCRYYPKAFGALRYFIDEASEDGRERARRRLASFKPLAERVEFRRLSEMSVEPHPRIIFSNELLDALPVHLVTMREGKLVELCVGLDDAGAFVWVEREPSTPRLEAHFAEAGVTLSVGQLAEVNLEAEEWMRRAASVLKSGYLVTVDYGAEAGELYGAPHRREGTLRAFREHRLSENVLDRPGEQDLTTTVNWTQLRRAGERAGLRTVLLERQDEFLLRAGLLEQLELLTRDAASEADVVRLRLGAREMILPGGMSGSFQVLVQKRA